MSRRQKGHRARVPGLAVFILYEGGGCPTPADAWHRAEEYPGSRRHDEKSERGKAQREEAMPRWRVRTPGLRGDVSIF